MPPRAIIVAAGVWATAPGFEPVVIVTASGKTASGTVSSTITVTVKLAGAVPV